MLRSRFVAVGVAFALMSVLALAGAGITKTGGGGTPPPPPPGDSGWRAYTDMNYTTCAVQAGSQVWVGTSYAGLAVYDVTTANLLAKYHGAKDALAAPETIVHLVDLPSDSILDIVTQNDIVWAATDEGLVRINPSGPTFKTYTRLDCGLSSDYIRRIMLDVNPAEPDRIYFMTDYGVCSATYDYVGDDWNDDWEYFNSWQYPPNDYNCGFASDNVFCIGFEQCADERVFFGTDCGVLVFDPSMPEDDAMRWFCWDTSNSGLPSNLVIDVAFAECRELFFATNDGLAALEDGEWRIYTRASTASLGLLDDDIVRMIVDPDDDTLLWLATPRGVNIYDRVNDTWSRFTCGDSDLVWDDVRGMSFSGSNACFATAYGVSLREPPGTLWRTYLDPLAFRGCVSALGFYSYYDLMFVGTYGGGLYILDDGDPATPDWEHYTVGDGSGLPSNFITAIDMVDDEDYVMFLGTDEGFAVGEGDYDDLDFTTYNMSNTSGGLISNAVTAVAAYEGADELALIGTQHGLAVYDNRFPSQGLRWTFATVESSGGGLADDWVNDVAVSRDGSTFWLATMWGASSYDPIADVWQTFRTTNSGLISDIVFCVDVDPEGNPWFGTMRGVCTCAPDGTNWHSYRKNNTGLASDIVLSIEVDYAGYVWAGTDAGLSCLNPGLGVCDYNYFVDDSGLFSNRICSIDVDAYGNRWFGTQVGVSELLNRGPSLYGGMVTPDSGDRTTVFTYSVHYSDPECEAPVEIYVRIDSGSPIDLTLVSGDYCDGTWEFSITGDVLQPGPHDFRFYANEAEYNWVNDGPYSGPTVSAAPYSPDPYEWDDSCTAATLLPTDGTWHDGHNLEPPGDEDWFAFDAEYNITYVIDVEDDNDPDYAGNVYLYDLGDPCPGALLREDLGSDEAHIVFPCLVTGRYYIKVEQANPAEVGAYKIRVYGPQWPMIQRDLERAGAAVGDGPSTTNLLWIYTIPVDIITTAPVVDGQGNVYFGTSDNSLLAVATDGTLKWSYHTADAVSATPALTYDEKIIFATEGGELYALNSDGTQAWVYNGALGNAIHAGVTVNRVENYTIYFGADNGVLYAVHSNGTGKWQYAPPVPDEITGTIMVGELENIYFGGGCGTFHVLFPDGTLAWNYETGLYDNEMAAAMATDGSIFFGTSTRRFCCVEPPAPPDMPGAGTLRWDVIMPASVYSVPVIAPDGTVFFGCDDGILYSMGQHSTATTVVFDVGAPIRSALVIDGSGKIYFGADSNKYYCITSDGTLVWDTDNLLEPPAFSCAIDKYGTLYWAKPDGKLVAFNDIVVPDFMPPASDCWSPTFANASTVPIVVGFNSWDTGQRKTGVAYTELWVALDGGLWGPSGLSAKLGTSGEFAFMPTVEGVFDFATVAYDNATPPNSEFLPFVPKTTTVFDETMPTSLCDVEHYVIDKADIEVDYTLEDDLSGPAKTRLWLRFNDGMWSYSGLEEPGAAGTFIITLPEDNDGSYYFITQGVDNAENWELAPWDASEPEAWLIYDRVPPTSACTAPLEVETAPIPVGYTAVDIGSGVDSVSIYYTYNDDGADLAAWRRYPATGAGQVGSLEFTPRPQSPWNEGPGQYLFVSCARDKCGNVEDFARAIGEGNVATTTYRPGRPTCVASCEPYTNSLPILIDYVATDRSGMGIASVSLYYSPQGQLEMFTGQIQYGVDSGTFVYSGPAGNPLADGMYGFRVEAHDMAGSVQADGLGRCAILLDRNAGISRASGPAFSIGGPISIEYTAWDDLSGVDSVMILCRYITGGWVSPMLFGEGEFGVIEFDALGGDGPYDFYSIMQDKAGNVEAAPDVPDFTTIRDTAAPSSYVIAPGLVSVSPVEVVYQCDSDLSGVARVDLLVTPPGGAEWIESGLSSTEPSGTFYLPLESGEGLYKVVTRATDGAGNVELIASWAEVTFDASAPVSTCSGPFATPDAPIDIDFSATDAISEVLDVELWYRYAAIIGQLPGDWVALATPATVASGVFVFAPPLDEGIYDFYTLATDIAGNSEPQPDFRTFPKATVRYDVTPPVSNTLICVIVGDDERECSTVRFVTELPFIVSFVATDRVSGVVRTTIYYRFNGGTWRDIGWTTDLPIGQFVFDIDHGVGAYDFVSISRDAAGNQEPLGDAKCTAHIDLDAPSSTCASDEYVSAATILVSYTAEDDSDFVDTDLYYREDEGVWTDSGLTGHDMVGTLEFAPDDDGIYDFFTHARDMAGRSEIMKNEPECTTIYDTTPPSSFVEMPAYVSTATITNLECHGLDNISGIFNIRIYSRLEAGEFTFTGLETDDSEDVFTYYLSEGEGRYEFFSIARDMAGNVQATPPSVTPCYLDMTPPTSSCVSVRIYGPLMLIQYLLEDNLSGISIGADIHLWFSLDGGEWQEATRATTGFPLDRWFRFEPPQERGEYSFYTIAVDRAGNVEPPPAEADVTFTFSEVKTFPEALDFGKVFLGQSSIEDLQLINVGTADISVTAVVAVSSEGYLSEHFRAISSIPVTVPAEDYNTIAVRFTPATLGTITAVLRIWWQEIGSHRGGITNVDMVGFGDEPSPPTIGIEARSSAERGDEEMIVEASLANPGPSREVEAFVAVEDPVGNLWFWPEWTMDVSGIHLDLPDGFELSGYELMRVPLSGVLPGSYTFYAALAVPGTRFEFIGSVSVAHFDVN